MAEKKRVFLVFKRERVSSHKTVEDWARRDIVGVVIASSYEEAAEKLGGVFAGRIDGYTKYHGHTVVSIPVDPNLKEEGFVQLKNGLRAYIDKGQDMVHFDIIDVALIL